VTRIVGIALVHNEDLFVEQAIRNVIDFCDRIHVVDHMSTDSTWEIVRALGREFDHLDVRRAGHAKVSHEVLEPYAGTGTWVLRVDGDELYDPVGLAILRDELFAGASRGFFRVLGNVLHSVGLEEGGGRASGYLSPPSRPISALYNLAALDSWTGCPERLHGGQAAFRSGYDWGSVDPLYKRFLWDDSPLRCLHVCFLRRSSSEVVNGPRPNLGELGAYRRGLLGTIERSARRLLGRPAGDPRQVAMRAAGSGWKQEKYCRGELLTVDVSRFFPQEEA